MTSSAFPLSECSIDSTNLTVLVLSFLSRQTHGSTPSSNFGNNIVIINNFTGSVQEVLTNWCLILTRWFLPSFCPLYIHDRRKSFRVFNWNLNNLVDDLKIRLTLIRDYR